MERAASRPTSGRRCTVSTAVGREHQYREVLEKTHGHCACPPSGFLSTSWAQASSEWTLRAEVAARRPLEWEGRQAVRAGRHSRHP